MKIFRLLTLFALALFSFLLVSCAAANPKPTATVIVAEPTETSAPLPTATELMEIPTSTPEPTQQPVTVTPTLVKPCPCDVKYPNVYSPSENWLVVTAHTANREDGLTSKFVHNDGRRQWDISFNDFYIKPYRANDVNIDKLFDQAFIPVRWTTREDYVYLAVPAAEEKAPYKSYDALFRLDLASGQITQTLDAATAPFTVSYAFKFSPGTKLAHINQNIQTVEIIIDDTLTGDAQTIKLDARFTQAGNLLWPPDDEKRLVVSAFDANTNGGGYALIVYNFETNKNEYIIQKSTNAYLPIDWLDADTIYAQEYPTGKWVYINLVTKAISEALAPTPAP